MEGSFFIDTFIFIWLGVITFLLARFLRTFSKITKGVSEKDLRVILEEILKKIGEQEKNNSELRRQIELIEKNGLKHIQKISLIRYNPFLETGGNQSFVLSLLDAQDSGIVITSLHSREATRIFAKPVAGGKENGYEFSKEEIQSILLAQKTKVQENKK